MPKNNQRVNHMGEVDTHLTNKDFGCVLCALMGVSLHGV